MTSSSKNKASKTKSTKSKAKVEKKIIKATVPQAPVRELASMSLRKTGANRRIDALFKAMSSDFLLQEQFVTEPSQLLSEFVHSKKLGAGESLLADQFVFSVMSNNKLLSWFQDYVKDNGGRLPNKKDLVKDFSHAVVVSDAHHVVTALARASASKHDMLALQTDFLGVIFESIAAGLGNVLTTEMSTGHTTGTEMSTGHIAATEMSTGHTTGTEMSTGHVFTTEMSTGHTTGTEMSTGHIAATEMSTGHTTGTEMSTGHVFTTEMSTGHTTGTEMSTGHLASTEMSTGHTTGTEMSTGHAVGDITNIFMPHHRATFASLIQHAHRLSAIGALDQIK